MGDTSRHLTYFKVENFKRFESFEMKDLGQFNLIVGDNNVGKTSVLEALLVCDSGQEFLNRLTIALSFKKVKDNYKIGDIELFLNKDAKSINNYLSFSFNLTFRNQQNQIITVEFDWANLVLLIKGTPKEYARDLTQASLVNYVKSLPFIPFFKGHDNDLTIFYSRYLQQNKTSKENFKAALSVLIPDIEDLELSNPYPDSGPILIIWQNHKDTSLPLAMFGDGAIKLFRLLAEIILNRGNRLMIDEIDAGIHYSRFKQFWKVILQAAKDNDVQLFMTTHNEECIRYFKETIEDELPDLKKDVRNITLVEHATSKKVTAHTFDFEQFEHAINVGNEIRG